MARIATARARAGNIGLAWLMLGPLPLFFNASAAAQVASPPPVKAPAKTASKAPASCAKVFFYDEDPNNAAAKLRGFRFDLAGACARVTGSLDNTYQNDLAVNITDGTSNNPTSTYTATAKANLDTSRKTSLGTLTTNTMLQWQKSTNDGTQNGNATVQSLYGSLAGVTVGYTNSLIDFWGGDFQFLATTSSESVGLVSYEHAILDNVKLAVAAESGLPSASQSAKGIQGLDTTSPDATARLRYYHDSGATLHLSGLLRRADFPATHASPAYSKTGWATNIGVSAPFRMFGNDTFSVQFDYAVNAVQTLGTAADIRQAEQYAIGPTRGWDIVASINHPWTATLESNAFVSYVAVDVDAPHAKPSARSTRLAANIYWRPIDHLRLGAEIGWVHAKINADGLEGLPFSKLDGFVGFLSARLEF